MQMGMILHTAAQKQTCMIIEADMYEICLRT